MSVMSLVSQLTLLQEAMGYMELQSLNQLQFARRVRNISDLERSTLDLLVARYRTRFGMDPPEDCNHHARRAYLFMTTHAKSKCYNPYLDALFMWARDPRSR